MAAKQAEEKAAKEATLIMAEVNKFTRAKPNENSKLLRSFWKYHHSKELLELIPTIPTTLRLDQIRPR
jgi:hypothetical protein